jgi:hypothetical protein
MRGREMLSGNNLKISAILSAHARAGNVVGQQPNNHCLKISARRFCRGRRVPAPGVAACATSPCRLQGWRHAGEAPPGQPAQPHAGSRGGGTSLPALAVAAGATCRLPTPAATQRWSFLAIIFRGGPFCQYTRAGGLFRQKFLNVWSC